MWVVREKTIDGLREGPRYSRVVQCVHSLDKCVWWKWWKSEGLGVDLCVVDELESVTSRV